MTEAGKWLPAEPDEEMALAGRKALCAVADRMEAAKMIAASSVDFWQQVGHQPANEVYRAMYAAFASPEPDALAEARAVIEPFAEAASLIAQYDNDSGSVTPDEMHIDEVLYSPDVPTVADHRAARAWLDKHFSAPEQKP